MHRVATLYISCGLAALVGCGGSDNEAATDSAANPPAAATPAAEPAPAPISLADLAGTWKMRSTPETGDTTSIQYELHAKAEPSGWTLNFPKRKPIPVRVTPGGDSLLTDAGPYPSVIRKGVQVRTQGVMRLQDGKLVGTTVARYTTSGPDSVVRLRTEGTKAP
jgi:hypothetical protein